ncbi:MAG: gas vesicle protein K [bacterium]
MPIDIDEDNLKHGLLGLVIAIVEIIRDALKHQALRRMEGGSLNDEEIERLGRALEEIDIAIDQLKEEQGITGTVKNVRDGLDDLVDDVLDQMVNPERWAKEQAKKEKA